MTKTLVFYVGLNDQHTKQQTFSIFEAGKIAMQLTGKHFGGGNITENKGFYTHENGEVVVENSLRIETVTDKNPSQFLQEIKSILNQESVLMQEITATCSFC